MMNKIIAYCGLICSECEAYVATQGNDHVALEQVAAKWRQEHNAPELTVQSVICDGCLTRDGRRCSYCAECKICACAVERGVLNCAHCAEYACEELERFFGFVPVARTVLDGVRGSL